MEDPSVYKIFHNGKFDWKFLQHQLGIDVHPILDTMQTGQILDNGLLERQEGHYSLGGMADRFLDLKLEKDQNLRTSFNGGHTARTNFVMRLWTSMPGDALELP